MKRVDFHVHSTLQAFGQTFKPNKTKKDKNRENLWFYNPPICLKKYAEKWLGISPYSQGNFTSAMKGEVKVLGVSLYPPEISFFKNKLPRRLGNNIENIVTRYSVDRIEEIESGQYEYFRDVKDQYKFLLDATSKPSPNKRYHSLLATKFDDIKTAEDSTLSAFFSIEGAHAFDCGYPEDVKQGKELSPNQKEKIRENVLYLKSLDHHCLYVTFCHHFYNQLCGHCKSLPDSISNIVDQSIGLNAPFTEFGEEIIHLLLSKDQGKRILIDIKHMSLKGREKLHSIYNKIQIDTGEVIPLVYSHGGPNGRSGFADRHSKDNDLNTNALGLFDVEIIKIAETRGVIGLNMDQRVMSSEDSCKKVKRKTLIASKRKKKMLWSGILWKNIKYVAELLDSHNLDPWSCMVLGSDFDGAINPINHFLQEADIPELSKYIGKHITAYYQSMSCRLKPENKLEVDVVLDRLFSENAMRFLKKNME